MKALGDLIGNCFVQIENLADAAASMMSLEKKMVQMTCTHFLLAISKTKTMGMPQCLWIHSRISASNTDYNDVFGCEDSLLQLGGSKQLSYPLNILTKGNCR
ncbi:hypothetical protein HPP92_012227 [Vanilla planifolia]|uniref:Uncharacterized protein n=1 Tax=Vanilla planifolia TaxID=51239 RepID=A0A835RCX6_VANPL|nr:hypothetical protein HPP92_012227 [Vanilla planifolia]